jgi:hypothetical protein
MNTTGRVSPFTMNLRHTAALALAGWYLMIPPIYDDNRIHLEAPLSQWTVIKSFDSAKECEQVVSGIARHEGPPISLRLPLGASSDQLHQLITQATCVSTDDPHLKEN